MHASAIAARLPEGGAEWSAVEGPATIPRDRRRQTETEQQEPALSGARQKPETAEPEAVNGPARVITNEHFFRLHLRPAGVLRAIRAAAAKPLAAFLFAACRRALMQLEFHQLDRRWEHLRVRHPGRQQRLLASLAALGQQTPIVVVAVANQPDRYVVIDGYKRIAALQQLGRDTVDAVVWPMSEAEALCAGPFSALRHA
jgi:uncharacterized ParB-like nuclease family protein